jgi:hypothetical protein
MASNPSSRPKLPLLPRQATAHEVGCWLDDLRRHPASATARVVKVISARLNRAARANDLDILDVFISRQGQGLPLLQPLGLAAIHAATAGQLPALGKLFSAHPDFLRPHLGKALAAAAEGGHLACVEFLAPHAAQEIHETGVGLDEAAHAGHESIVEFLLPLSPAFIRSRALGTAAAAGHVGCLKRLLPWANVNDPGDPALWHAARQGQKACINILGPLTDMGMMHSLTDSLSNRIIEEMADYWHADHRIELMSRLGASELPRVALAHARAEAQQAREALQEQLGALPSAESARAPRL